MQVELLKAKTARPSTLWGGGFRGEVPPPLGKGLAYGLRGSAPPGASPAQSFDAMTSGHHDPPPANRRGPKPAISNQALLSH